MYAVVQLCEAMRYKRRDRGFDSRWDHWDMAVWLTQLWFYLAVGSTAEDGDGVSPRNVGELSRLDPAVCPRFYRTLSLLNFTGCEWHAV